MGGDLERQPEARSHKALQTMVKDLRFYSRDLWGFWRALSLKGSLWKDVQAVGGRSGAGH